MTVLDGGTPNVRPFFPLYRGKCHTLRKKLCDALACNRGRMAWRLGYPYVLNCFFSTSYPFFFLSIFFHNFFQLFSSFFSTFFSTFFQTFFQLFQLFLNFLSLEWCGFQTLLSSTIVPPAAQTLPQNQVTTHLWPAPAGPKPTQGHSPDFAEETLLSATIVIQALQLLTGQSYST